MGNLEPDTSCSVNLGQIYLFFVGNGGRLMGWGDSAVI